MNNTPIQQYLWPYALRGSVTIIVENTTIEKFEQTIYRHLRQSIAKIVRQFCSLSSQTCLSRDTHAIRADHVIIQSYEEQLDDRRLYVAVFIKDPYRQDIALTNDQFLLALKRHRQQLYQDIKHHINLPSNIFDQTSLDPIWLYGVCLLALLVLVVVILMLVTILARRTVKTQRVIGSIQHTEKVAPTVQLARGEDDDDDDDDGEDDEERPSSSSLCNTSEDSQTSTSLMLIQHPSSSYAVNPNSTSSYFHPRTSYFNSAFEKVIRQHLHDEEPIPFIDESISVSHSRKSSACWSDRTSLSSRFGFAWKLNLMRSNLSHTDSSTGGTRKFQYRTVRYPVPTSRQYQV